MNLFFYLAALAIFLLGAVHNHSPRLLLFIFNLDSRRWLKLRLNLLNGRASRTKSLVINPIQMPLMASSTPIMHSFFA
jgi:hypothetical protein